MFRGESGKWTFQEDWVRGSFKGEVNCQMQLKRQKGRKVRKTPDLAKEDNYYLEAAEGRRMEDNRSQKTVVLSSVPERPIRSTFESPVV